MTGALFETVCITDPAIDMVKLTIAAMRDYCHHSRNLALLPFREGILPMRFRLRKIPHMVAASYVDIRTTDSAKYVAAFRASVMEVQDGVVWNDQLNVMKSLGGELWKPRLVDTSRVPIETASSLLEEDELAMFDPPTVQEIGAVAWSRSCFFHRGTVQHWLLPLSSEQIYVTMAGRLRFLAELEKSSAAAGPTVSSPPASVATTSPSVEPGDATATDAPTSLPGG